MADVTLYHNPRCTKSRQALQIAEDADAGFTVDVVKYLESPPSADELRAIVAKLEDEPAPPCPAGTLGRARRHRCRHRFAGEVVDVLTKHPSLMERPLIVTADRAFIGRPTGVSEFFGAGR